MPRASQITGRIIEPDLNQLADNARARAKQIRDAADAADRAVADAEAAVAKAAAEAATAAAAEAESQEVWSPHKLLIKCFTNIRPQKGSAAYGMLRVIADVAPDRLKVLGEDDNSALHTSSDGVIYFSAYVDTRGDRPHNVTLHVYGIWRHNKFTVSKICVYGATVNSTIYY